MRSMVPSISSRIAAALVALSLSSLIPFAGTVAHWIKTPLTFALGGLITGAVFFFVMLNRRKEGPPDGRKETENRE